jgi:hypothetical protein
MVVFSVARRRRRGAAYSGRTGAGATLGFAGRSVELQEQDRGGVAHIAVGCSAEPRDASIATLVAAWRSGSNVYMVFLHGFAKRGPGA